MANEQALTPQGQSAVNALLDSTGDDDTPITPGTTGDADYDPAIVEAAKRQGWKPRDQFDGPEEEWVPPDVFNDRAMQINPILRAKNARMEAALRKAEQRMEQMEARLAETQKESISQTRKEIERKIAGWRAERAEAISQADGARVNELDEQIDAAKADLVKYNDTPAGPAPSAPRPEMVEAAQQMNVQFPWLGKDTRKSNIALALARTLQETRPDLQGRPEFFTELAKEIRATLGERDTRGGFVDGGGSTNRGYSSGSKGYHNMPQEAKDACDRDVARKLFANREEYAKMYWEQENDR